MRNLVEEQFGELQEAVKKAHLDVLSFLEEKERAAVNHANGIKIHLEHKCAMMEENKCRVEKMVSHTNDTLFLQVPYSTRLSHYKGLRNSITAGFAALRLSMRY